MKKIGNRILRPKQTPEDIYIKFADDMINLGFVWIAVVIITCLAAIYVSVKS